MLLAHSGCEQQHRLNLATCLDFLGEFGARGLHDSEDETTRKESRGWFRVQDNVWPTYCTALSSLRSRHQRVYCRIFWGDQFGRPIHPS